jgi:hypothetical protein
MRVCARAYVRACVRACEVKLCHICLLTLRYECSHVRVALQLLTNTLGSNVSVERLLNAIDSVVVSPEERIELCAIDAAL